MPVIAGITTGVMCDWRESETQGRFPRKKNGKK